MDSARSFATVTSHLACYFLWAVTLYKLCLLCVQVFVLHVTRPLWGGENAYAELCKHQITSMCGQCYGIVVIPAPKMMLLIFYFWAWLDSCSFKRSLFSIATDHSITPLFHRKMIYKKSRHYGRNWDSIGQSQNFW